MSNPRELVQNRLPHVLDALPAIKDSLIKEVASFPIREILLTPPVASHLEPGYSADRILRGSVHTDVLHGGGKHSL